MKNHVFRRLPIMYILRSEQSLSRRIHSNMNKHENSVRRIIFFNVYFHYFHLRACVMKINIIFSRSYDFRVYMFS